MLLIFSLALAARADDFERLTRQYQDYIMQRGGMTRRARGGQLGAQQLARTLQEDGSWREVNYKDTTRGGWLPYDHLGRVYTMVRAYKSPGSAGDPQLREAIHKALGHWLAKDYQCPNWWYNVIGVPQTMGSIAILMRDELTPAEFDGIVNKILPRGKIGMTGQNRVWVAGITLVRGLLKKDHALVTEAARVIGEEIRVTTAEGVQPDFSFHQHGPQLQFGNYGLSFAGDSAMWMRIFAGTPFAFPKEKLNILNDYMTEGQSWVVWKGLMDISSCGRQLGRGAQSGKGRAVARVMELLTQIDPDRAADYQAHLKRNAAGGANDLLGVRHFWRSDVMVQRAPDYYASVKMASRRVIGAELVNSENMSGYHLADGALYLYRGGAEYEDIQPVWDWRKLPGVTCPQPADGPPRLRKRYHIDSDFVGGVTDGKLGCAALDYVRDGVRARKAWFFVDGAIVCLGAGIAAEGAAPVATAVEQRWLKGGVTLGVDGREAKLAPGMEAPAGVNWAWHDGVGYLFPQGGKLALRAGEQRGSWRKVEDKVSVSPREVAGDVFLAYFDHGARPRDDRYAYILLPGASLESMRERAGRPGVQMLENSARLQAVRAAEGRVIQAAFYEAGRLDCGKGKTLAVNQPCLVQLDARDGKSRLSVADPTQKLERLSVTVDGKTQTVNLPRGGEAGKSVTVEL